MESSGSKNCKELIRNGFGNRQNYPANEVSHTRNLKYGKEKFKPLYKHKPQLPWIQQDFLF